MRSTLSKAVEDLKKKLEGAYIKAGVVGEDARVRGSRRIEKREDHKMIVMIGLPASGKMTWVNKHLKENLEKQYNVISTTTMINNMTVNGEPRK